MEFCTCGNDSSGSIKCKIIVKCLDYGLRTIKMEFHKTNLTLLPPAVYPLCSHNVAVVTFVETDATLHDTRQSRLEEEASSAVSHL
jgi:hypothetical protein